jgi:hypothetical protein
MKTKFLTSSLVVAIGAVGVGFGDQSDLSLSSPTTATQAVAQIINVAPATQTINEGGAASMTFSQVCVSDANRPVTIEVDFADPNVTNDVVSRVVDPPVGGFVAGACSPAFDACDASAPCAPLTHIYPDNLGTVTAVARAFHDEVGDQRHRFGVVELHAAFQPSARHLRGHRHQQLVLFAGRQVHASPPGRAEHGASRLMYARALAVAPGARRRPGAMP